MAAEKFHIDLDELHRSLACAALIALSVAFVYKTLDFTVSTVRLGVVNTWNALYKRAQSTMETLANPIEDLIMNADELGTANLFERYPYPEKMEMWYKKQGLGEWKVSRFAVVGSNLDVLRRIEVNLDGLTLQEDCNVETPVVREAEHFEWTPRVVSALTSIPVKATVAVVGLAGSRWRHQVSVVPHEEVDDSVLASKTKKPPVTAVTPTTGPSGTPASTAASAPPTPDVATDDGAAELAQMIDGLSMLPAKRRGAYVKALKDENFKEAELGALLGELNRARAKPAEIDQQIVRVLSDM